MSILSEYEKEHNVIIATIPIFSAVDSTKSFQNNQRVGIVAFSKEFYESNPNMALKEAHKRIYEKRDRENK